MRKLLLASSAVFLLSGGVALAGNQGDGGGQGYGQGGGTTTTVVAVPIKNATSVGTGNSSATTGGTAVSASLTNSANTANSNNSAFSLTKNLSDVGNTALEFVRTDTKIDVTLASSTNNGSVSGDLQINDPTCGCSNGDGRDGKSSTGYGALTGNASMDHVNGGQGILTAEQNTGVNALQQSSVALGSVVTGSSNSGVGGL